MGRPERVFALGPAASPRIGDTASAAGLAGPSWAAFAAPSGTEPNPPRTRNIPASPNSWSDLLRRLDAEQVRTRGGVIQVRAKGVGWVALPRYAFFRAFGRGPHVCGRCGRDGLFFGRGRPVKVFRPFEDCEIEDLILWCNPCEPRPKEARHGDVHTPLIGACKVFVSGEHPLADGPKGSWVKRARYEFHRLRGAGPHLCRCGDEITIAPRSGVAVVHVDGDWRNDSIDNLEAVCRGCFAKRKERNASSVDGSGQY